MTPEQEFHLAKIQDLAINKIEIKYRRGQLEHGGNLWEKGDEFLLNAAIEEAIDQVVYLLTLRETLTTKLSKSSIIR